MKPMGTPFPAMPAEPQLIEVPKPTYYALRLGLTETFRWDGKLVKLRGKRKRLAGDEIQYFVEVEQ